MRLSIKSPRIVLPLLCAVLLVAASCGGGGGGGGHNQGVGTALSAPDTFTAIPVSSEQIDLAWTEVGSLASRYEIERSIDGINFYRICSLPRGNRTLSCWVPWPEYTYYFRMRVLGEAGGYSPYTAIVPATTGVPPWAFSFGESNDESASSIAVATDGEYVLVGSTESFGAGGSDFWYLRLDRYGAILFEGAYGGPEDDQATAIAATSDGGCILAGTTESFGAAGYADLWVIKLESDGSIGWQKSYGGAGYDYAESILQTRDGHYVLTGTTESFGLGPSDLWVLQLAPEGSIVWETCYGEAYDDYGRSIIETSDGGFVVVGDNTYSGAGGSDVWVVRLESDGSIAWQNAYGGGGHDHAYSIVETSEGGLAVIATTSSFGSGPSDVWILKLEPAGSVEWQKTYGSAFDDYARAGVLAIDGGLFVAGDSTWWGAGLSDFWVMHISPDGIPDQQKTYGGGKVDHAFGLSLAPDSGFVVAGQTESFGVGKSDYWLMKCNYNGTIEFRAFGGAKEFDTAVFVGDTSVDPIQTSAVATATSALSQDTDCTVTVTACKVREQTQ